MVVTATVLDGYAWEGSAAAPAGFAGRDAFRSPARSATAGGSSCWLDVGKPDGSDVRHYVATGSGVPVVAPTSASAAAQDEESATPAAPNADPTTRHQRARRRPDGCGAHHDRSADDGASCTRQRGGHGNAVCAPDAGQTTLAWTVRSTGGSPVTITGDELGASFTPVQQLADTSATGKEVVVAPGETICRWRSRRSGNPRADGCRGGHDDRQQHGGHRAHHRGRARDLPGGRPGGGGDPRRRGADDQTSASHNVMTPIWVASGPECAPEATQIR